MKTMCLVVLQKIFEHCPLRMQCFLVSFLRFFTVFRKKCTSQISNSWPRKSHTKGNELLDVFFVVRSKVNLSSRKTDFILKLNHFRFSVPPDKFKLFFHLNPVSDDLKDRACFFLCR